MKLALGTAQFGLNYGVANTAGQMNLEGARSVMALAKSQGMDTLDTAIAYGESERTLGRIGIDGWKTVTKLPALPAACEDVSEWVQTQMEGSLKRLGTRQLHAVLLHRPAELFKQHGPELLRSLQDLVNQGTARKIGVSVYEPAELDRLFALFRFDLVQAPLNVMDRRLLVSGWAHRLKDFGVELHTRSAFLQGLLLMPSHERPKWFGHWHTLWSSWDCWLEENQLSPIDACLRYVLSIPEVDRVVVGVDSVAHLQEILISASGLCPDYATAPCTHDPVLLNPAQWKLS